MLNTPFLTSRHPYIHKKDLKTRTLRVKPVPRTAAAYGRELKIYILIRAYYSTKKTVVFIAETFETAYKRLMVPVPILIEWCKNPLHRAAYRKSSK